MAKRENTLGSKLGKLELNENILVDNSYMTTMVTLSRLKKDFNNSNKKFKVKETQEGVIVTRVK